MYREQVLDNYYMVKSASKGARERRANNFLSFLPASRTGLQIKNLPNGRLKTLSKALHTTLSKEAALENYYLVKEGNVFANLGSKAAKAATNATNKVLQPLKSVQLGGPGSKNIGEFISKPGMTLPQKANTVKNQFLNNQNFRNNLFNTTVKQPAMNVAQKVSTPTGEGVLSEVLQAVT